MAAASSPLIPVALRPYRSFIWALALLTLLEWALFAAEPRFLARPCVPPMLLALSSIKLALAVAWFARAPGGLDWRHRALPVGLVFAGGIAILMAA